MRAWVLGLLLLAGCSRGAWLEVSRVGAMAPRPFTVDVALTLHNDTDAEVFYSTCELVHERSVQGVWQSGEDGGTRPCPARGALSRYGSVGWPDSLGTEGGSHRFRLPVTIWSAPVELVSNTIDVP